MMEIMTLMLMMIMMTMMTMLELYPELLAPHDAQTHRHGGSLGVLELLTGRQTDRHHGGGVELVPVKERHPALLVHGRIVDPDQGDVVVGPDLGGPTTGPPQLVLVVDHQLQHPEPLSPAKFGVEGLCQGHAVSPKECRDGEF